MTPIEVIKNMNFCGLCTTGNCAECDRKIAKDEAIKALEEVQQYRELEHKLNGVDLKMLVNHWMEFVAEGEVQGYQRGRILTNEDADKWDAYRAIGTPEECRAAVEKQKAKKPTYDDYHRAGYRCQTCNNVNPWGYKHCKHCGQKLDWSDEK